jgi:hypothetical protein
MSSSRGRDQHRRSADPAEERAATLLADLRDDVPRADALVGSLTRRVR